MTQRLDTNTAGPDTICLYLLKAASEIAQQWL